MKYKIRKLHNAVGTVWLSKQGDWTQKPENIKLHTLEEAQKQYEEFSALNDGRGLECLAIENAEVIDFQSASKKLKQYYSDSERECINIFLNHDPGYDKIEVLKQFRDRKTDRIFFTAYTSYTVDELERLK